MAGSDRNRTFRCQVKTTGPCLSDASPLVMLEWITGGDVPEPRSFD